MEVLNEDKWIGIEDAANYLGVNKDTVRNWIKKYKGIPDIIHILQYIVDHDNWKISSLDNYKKMPKRTKRQKKEYLNQELYNIIMQCTPEKQRLIYKIAKVVAISNFV